MKIYSVAICDSDQTSGIYALLTFTDPNAAVRKLRKEFVDEAVRYGYKRADVLKCAEGTYTFPESGDWDEPQFRHDENGTWASVGSWTGDIVETDLVEEVAKPTIRETLLASNEEVWYKVISAWREYVNAEAEEWICDTHNPDDLKLLLDGYGWDVHIINPHFRYCLAGTNYEAPTYLEKEAMKALALTACGEMEEADYDFVTPLKL